MDYIFYLGLVIVVSWLYDKLAVSISIFFGYWGRRLQKRNVYYVFFYISRLIRAYLCSSILLIFARYYIATGLSAVWIMAISYFVIAIWWLAELLGARDEWDKTDIEYDLVVNKYVIIWVINTAMFFLIYVAYVPAEPYVSKLIFTIIMFLADYKLFEFAVMVGGGFSIVVLVENLILLLPRLDDEKMNKD